MALADGQVQVRGLTFGPGTDYRVLADVDPWSMSVRADQTGQRAWNHGSWSGAEWAVEKPVPIPVVIDTNGDKALWLERHQALVAALAPVGDVAQDVELRIGWAGTEYLLFGRPRMAELRPQTAGAGVTVTRCAFVATDPLIYSGTLHTTDPVTLPTFVGGLATPFLLPTLVETVRVGGEADLINDGTAPSGLKLRIDGPIEEPWVAVQHPDGTVDRLTFDLTLPSGEWLIVDTAARTAFLRGLPQASRRGSVTATPDWPLVQPGTNTLRFGAADDDTGTVTAEHRSAWF